MADATRAKASKAVRRAQADFERSQVRHEHVREARRKSFEEARAGLASRCARSARRLVCTSHESPGFSKGSRDLLLGSNESHDAGRTVPVPATLAWMLEAEVRLNGSDCELLFTTPTGRIWRERNFYRDVWKRPSEPPA